MSDTIRDQVTDAMKAAMKAKEKQKLSAIRLIQADFKRIEVDERIEIDDERALVVLDKMRKQRKDSIQQFQQADRQDLAEQELFELEVIGSFLPEPLSDSKLSELIDAAIAETAASSMRDMGKVVALLKPQLQGRADMGQVSKQVKAKLTS